MKRSSIPELLDTDAGTSAEVAASLRDLRHINRWFGSISTVVALVQKVAAETRRNNLSFLDVAGASGDIAAAASKLLERQGISLAVTVLDRNPSHLNGNFRAVIGDALALPFRDKSFDLVACSTFLHHLEPDCAVQFAGEAMRVARTAVLINDLRRHWLHLALVYAGLPLFRSRLTWHDAPASVRRAYTPQELRAMLGKAGAARVEITRHYLFRMGAIIWVTES
jgi:ubiquinone/menaquinone biosynthesis C-methylase UbiE